MNWSYLFSSTIRTRGRQYYRSGAITKIEKTGNVYTAIVKGSHTYRVSVTIQEGAVQGMTCTCPYAQGGARCKHMAAVLCQIDNRPQSIQETAADPLPSSVPVLFSELKQALEIPGPYSYFKPALIIKRFSLTQELWKQALDLAGSGKITLEQITTGYPHGFSDNGSVVSAFVQGSFSSGRPHSFPSRISLVFDSTQLIHGQCSVSNCCCSYDSGNLFGKKRPCAHQLALFYLAAQKLKKDNPGDFTDRTGSDFLNRCQHFQVSERLLPNVRSGSRAAGAVSQLLDLTPRVHQTYNGYSVSFRVGAGKMFVIKDLTEFVRKTRLGETALFGSSTRFKLGEALFTPQGKQYYDFIQETLRQYQEYDFLQQTLSSHYFHDFKTIGQTIPLFGSLLDRFYEILGSDSAEFIPMEGKKTALMGRDTALPLSLTVAPVRGSSKELEGIQVSGQLPELLHGEQAAYYIEAPYLNRISPERMKELAPLPDPDNHGRLSFTIGRRSLSKFCYSILPWLRRVADVEEKEPEAIAACLPPEVHFTFYLDAEKDFITCRAEASYGDQFTAALKPLEPGEILPQPFRDKDQEGQAADAVLEYFPIIASEGNFYSEKDETAIFGILNTGVDQLLALGEVQSTERFRRLGIRTAPKLSVGVSMESGLLDLTISAEHISSEELAEILKSYQLRRKFHRLKNGDFLKLEDDSLELLSHLTNELGLSARELVKGKMHLPAYRSLYLNTLLEESQGLYTTRDRRFKQLVREFKAVSEADFEIPKGLNASLRPYQAMGYRWLRLLDAFGFGGILADEMGLGKTLQAIAVLAAVREEQGSCSALIITPASLVYNWCEEIRRFAPNLKAAIVTGSQKERCQLIHKHEDFDVLITSYDLLKRDADLYEGLTFSFQFLDEAQYIKNHSTTAAKAVKVIRSRSRFALTGTPIENRLSELWSIFDYLMPGFLYTYEAFKKTFETPIVKNKEEAVSARLRRMTGPFILRRLKKDVMKDLPEKLEEVRYARADKPQQELYDSQLSHMKTLLGSQSSEDFKKNKFQILAELTRLRQICCDPSLCFENYKGGSAKRETCMELIETAAESGHRMLIFSQFTSMLELLEGDLKKTGIPYFKITGSTPKEQRIQLVNEFNSGDTPVFLISLKAGGTGLNLTGADIVIHYDPWWNLAVQNQATDRAHRLGQTKTVTVYKLIVKGSIEEKILKLQEAKKDLADEILKGEMGNIGSLSKEELLDIIG